MFEDFKGNSPKLPRINQRAMLPPGTTIVKATAKQLVGTGDWLVTVTYEPPELNHESS